MEILRRIEQGVYQHDLVQKDAVTTDDIVKLQELTGKVYVDDAIKQYIVTLVQATRNPGSVIAQDLAKYVQFGGSPRAAISFMQAARALALIAGRDYVIPEDIKELRHTVLRHRIILNFEAIADNVHQESIIDAIFAAVQVP